MNRLETTGMEKCVRISMCDMRYPIMNNSEARGLNMHVFIYIYMHAFYTYMRGMPYDTNTHIETTQEKQVIVYMCVLYRISGYEANSISFRRSVGSFSSSSPSMPSRWHRRSAITNWSVLSYMHRYLFIQILENVSAILTMVLSPTDALRKCVYLPVCISSFSSNAASNASN